MSSRCISVGCSKPRFESQPYCIEHHKEQDETTYGLDNDVKQKLAAKFDPSKADEAQEWLEAMCGETFTEPNLQAALKSGVRLCTAINRIKPGSVLNISKLQTPFKQRENIEKYLKACVGLGFKSLDCFVTGDLYDGKNMVTVIDNIFILARKAKELGFVGPEIASVSVSFGGGTAASTYTSSWGADASGGATTTAPSTPLSSTASTTTSTPVTAAVGAVAMSPGGPKFCPDCGTKREEGGKFCSGCGFRYV